jgi:Holliday junction resolvase RusA-like endonuclease
MTTVPQMLPPGVLSIMRLNLDFPLRSKSNFRRSPGSGTWASHRDFEIAVGALARSARPKEWLLGEQDDPLKKRPVIVMVLQATTLLDTANLTKSLADALEGVLYHNDASVQMVLSTSQRARVNQTATVLLALLEPGSSTYQMRTALDTLLDTYQITSETE